MFAIQVENSFCGLKISQKKNESEDNSTNVEVLTRRKVKNT